MRALLIVLSLSLLGSITVSAAEITIATDNPCFAKMPVVKTKQDGNQFVQYPTDEKHGMKTYEEAEAWYKATLAQKKKDYCYDYSRAASENVTDKCVVSARATFGAENVRDESLGYMGAIYQIACTMVSVCEVTEQQKIDYLEAKSLYENHGHDHPVPQLPAECLK